MMPNGMGMLLYVPDRQGAKYRGKPGPGGPAGASVAFREDHEQTQGPALELERAGRAELGMVEKFRLRAGPPFSLVDALGAAIATIRAPKDSGVWDRKS